MPIQTGDKLPSMTLRTLGAEGPTEITTDTIFAGKKVVLFAVPGAFTPGCSITHLPGFVVHADTILSKGVDTIACIAVNDAFVMGAWGEANNAEHLLMLADGNGNFTREIDMELDASGFDMGTRSKRYAMIVEDGVITYLGLDEKGIDLSSAEKVLEQL